jgi:Skp family chaperone for outer membrane proteins
MKVFLFFLFLFFSGIVYAENKIVYVDFNYLLANSLASKSLNDQLNSLNKKNLIKFKKMEKDLEAKKNKVLAQKNILTEIEYKKKVTNYEVEVSKYKSILSDESKKMLKSKATAKSLILKNINPILSKYAKDNSISLILARKNILMGKTELDITKAIIEILDKKIKTIKLDK